MGRIFLKKEFFLNIFFVLLTFFVSFFIFNNISEKKISDEKERIYLEKIAKQKKDDSRKSILEKIKKDKKDFFLDLEVDAFSVYVYDLEKGEEIFAKDEDKKTGIASITKIVTSEVFLENNKKEDIKILLKNLDNVGNNNIYNGEVYKSLDAVSFMMVASSNDIASALTNNLGRFEFIKKMNIFAENIGLKSTLFFSESGLDASTNIAGAYSTSKEVFRIVKYFYEKYPEVSRNFSKKEIKICSDLRCQKVENTNELFFEEETFPYDILFSKTGYTKKTGGSLATILKIKEKKVGIIVLGSTKKGRFEDVKKIANKTKEFFER